MRFVETPVFTSAITDLLTDESYRALQLALVYRPDAGSLIPKGHGLRKLRWQSHGSGKRGGVRVIYYWSDGENTIYMLYVYQKTRQDDLTQAQLRALGKLCQEELK